MCKIVKLNSSECEGPNLEQSCVAPPKFPDVSVSASEEKCYDASEVPDVELMPWKCVNVAVSDPENRLWIPVTIAGHSVKALIDTGASSSMVTRSWMDTVGLSADSSYEDAVYGFGIGNRVRIVGRAQLGLETHGLQMGHQTFQIISDQHTNCPSVILAVDFLKTNQLSVDISRKRLRQKLNDGVYLDYYVPTDIEKCVSVIHAVPCFVTEAVEVPAKESRIVKVQCGFDVNRGKCRDCGHSEDLLVFDSASVSTGEVIHSGIMSRNSTVILVTNHGSAPINIEKGRQIGTLSSLLTVTENSLSGEVLVTTMEAPSKSDGADVTDPISSIEFGSHLSEQQKKEILTVLSDKNRKLVFSSGNMEIGKLNIASHRIELTDSTPIYQKPRRFPEHIASEIERQCQELELIDVIEPSTSAWSSPVVPIRKKDGTIRLCIDYRKLNAVTKPDRHPLPNLTDTLYSLSGVRYFTSLDLVRGYYQLPLDEDSRELTAFSTPHGLYQFKVLAFGLRNAPGAFQRGMTQILSEFPRDSVLVYIDDVLILSRTYEEHLEMVKKVLNTLAAYGVKIKPDKCSWFAEEVEYLGHLIGSYGVRKSPAYCQKIREFPRPTTIRQLREFLGLANWQRKFVPNFSTIQRPLSEKTRGRGGRNLVWTAEMESAFELLKEQIEQDVRLAYPDYSPDAEPLSLYVDASGIGAGACLGQSQDGQFRVIAYASTSFSKAETQYSTIDRELAALRWGVQTFRPFLIGTPFIIHTDHQPLIYLNNMKLVDSRLARTLENLADYNFKIQYTPGSQNNAADALSRLYNQDDVHDHGTDDFVPGRLPEGVVLLKEVPGGGNSLFESLFLLLPFLKVQSEISTPLRLREVLIDELLSVSILYGKELNRTERRKLRMMRLQGQLPAVQVLYAFGELFQCIVVVHYGGLTPVYYVSPAVTNVELLPKVHLQCLAGVHYNPLVETPLYSDRMPLHVRKLECGSSSAGNLDCGSDDDGSSNEEEVSTVSVVCPSSSWCETHSRTHFASLMVQIQGLQKCALVDTGAQVSCVSAAVVQQLQMRPNPCSSIRIIGLGSGTSSVHSTVELVIDWPGSGVPSGAHTFVVVSEEIMSFCLILGADFLKAEEISVDLIDGACELRGKVLGRFAPLQEPSVVLTVGIITMTEEGSRPARQIAVGSVSNQITLEIGESSENPYFTSLITRDGILTLQARSSQLSQLIRHLNSGNTTWPLKLKRFQRYKSSFKIKDSVLVFEPFPERQAVVVTFQLLVEIVLVLHNQLSHIGREKLIKLVGNHVWHPSLWKVARDVTRSCSVCQRAKISTVASPPMMSIQTNAPFELVALDLLALPANDGYIGALVVMDHHSKWLSAVPIRSKTSASIGAVFRNRILPYLPACPLKVLSDNGPEFVGKPFNDVLSEYGIVHQYTTPNCPSSNGLVERANRTLTELLRVSKDSRSWVDNLSRALVVHNSTCHSGLGKSPTEFLLTDQHVVGRVVPISDATDRWREGNPSFVSFRVGQKVLRKVVFRGRETVNKLTGKFEGPYVIDKVNDNGITYVIRHCVSGDLVRAHHRQLYPFYSPPAYLKRHPCFSKLNQEVDNEREVDIPDCSFPDEDEPVCLLDSFQSTSDATSADLEDFSSCESDTGTAGTDRSVGFGKETEKVALWDVSRLRSKLRDQYYRLAVFNKQDEPSPEGLPVDVPVSVEVKPRTVPEPVLQTTREDTSGLVVETDEEFWDLSEILPIGNVCHEVEPYINSWATEFEDHCLKLLDNNCEVLQQNIEVLTSALSLTLQSSFSGFLEEDVIKHEKEKERCQQKTVKGHLICDKIASAEKKLAEIRESVVKRQKNARKEKQLQTRQLSEMVRRSPVRTRSAGPVEDLPFVQQGILEYDKPRK